MIELGLVIAIGSLLVLPALAVSGRQLAARWQAQREAARARLELARERQEAAGQAERDRIDTLWREHPDIGGLTEYLRFIHLRYPNWYISKAEITFEDNTSPTKADRAAPPSAP